MKFQKKTTGKTVKEKYRFKIRNPRRKKNSRNFSTIAF